MALETINNFDDVLKIAKYMYDRQKSKADETVPKIMKLEACKAAEFYSSYLKIKSGYYSSERDPETSEEFERSLAKYLEKNAADIAALEAVHAANLPAIQNNTAIRAKVVLIMKELGIPDSWQERDYNSKARNPKYKTVGAGYLSDLNRNVPISDNYEGSLRILNGNPAKAKAHVEKKLAEIRKKEQDAAALKQKERREKVLVHMRVKYGTDPEAGADDVLEVILSKNKYLDLAHHLLENRNDWSDGFDIAEYALDRFIIETNEDHEIWTALNAILNSDDFDRDGRVFRDSEYGYDHVFGLVDDADLMADYNTISGYVNH